MSISRVSCQLDSVLTCFYPQDGVGTAERQGDPAGGATNWAARKCCMYIRMYRQTTCSLGVKTKVGRKYGQILEVVEVTVSAHDRLGVWTWS